MKTNKADFWFSRWIRIRDTQDDGYCRCITCGKIQHPKEADCGHWMKRQHQSTRFNEMNCAAQCGKCNRFEQGRDSDFERVLIERYGKQRVEMLKWSATQTVKRSKFDLEIIANYYKEKAIQLAKDKNLKIW